MKSQTPVIPGDVFEAVVASSESYRAAADTLGLGYFATYDRAKKLGVRPNSAANAPRTSGPEKTGAPAKGPPRSR